MFHMEHVSRENYKTVFLKNSLILKQKTTKTGKVLLSDYMSFMHTTTGLSTEDRESLKIPRETKNDGADRENRTPVSSLARTHSTTKPYPRTEYLYHGKGVPVAVRPEGFGHTYLPAGRLCDPASLACARSGFRIPPQQKASFCAPGGIRTPNDCFEGSYDIHFTTGAYRGIVRRESRKGNSVQ
jgi:hypothetical protein